MFRSYEPYRGAYVTLIADYLPLQDPNGGPNYFALDTNANYDIRIYNSGTGNSDIVFCFNFKTADKDIALNIGGQQVPIPLIDVGQIGVGGNPYYNSA